MKVYIGHNQTSEDFKAITEPAILNYIADDSECETIVLDGILKKMNLNDITGYLALVRKKLRLNGILAIKDIDFDLFCFIYGKNANFEELNKFIFDNGSINSMFNYEYILNLLNSSNTGLELESKNIDGINFILNFRRVS
jgi:hypothetical protein